MMMTETLMDLFAPELFAEQGMPAEDPFADPLFPDDDSASPGTDSDSSFEDDGNDESPVDGEEDESPIDDEDGDFRSDESSNVELEPDEHPEPELPGSFEDAELIVDMNLKTDGEIANGLLGAEQSDDSLGKSAFDPLFDFVTDIWDRFFQPFFDPDDIVHAGDFSADGSLDTKNHLVVVGNVSDDINYISKQTGQTCSLMAQEQFVHRLTGKPIPEEYLEWQAGKWNVYHPDIGTSSEGQEMILDHFNIPYDRRYNPDLDDIVKSMSKGNDILIGVDARVFYQDSSYPPGSGHAVALVGRGLDPATGDLKGFYVTDSNYPGGAHYVPTEQLVASWDGADMISVPEKLAA